MTLRGWRLARRVLWLSVLGYVLTIAVLAIGFAVLFSPGFAQDVLRFVAAITGG